MIINKMIIKTGSACSLKCKKCGEFNPYLAEKGKAFSVSMEQLTKDVMKVAQAVDSISLIDVAGGEALIHQDLYIFIQNMINVKNINKIHIISNGTIIPNKQLLEILSQNTDRVAIMISDYSNSGVDNSLLISVLKDNGINFYVNKDMTWLDKSDTGYKEYSDLELNHIAENCATYKKQPYYTLIDGKLSAHCPTAGSLMYYLDLYEQCEEEYINIREKEELNVECLINLDKQKMLHACNYCVPSYKASKCNAGEQI